MGFIKTPENLRGVFTGDRIYSATDGTHTIVSGTYEKPEGAVVSREVLVRGFANIHTFGLVYVLSYGGFTTAEEGGQVDAWGGQIEALACHVEAYETAAVIARRASVVFANGSNVVVHAYDDSIVVMQPGTPAKVKLFDRAQIVRLRSTRVERLSVRTAAAA